MKLTIVMHRSATSIDMMIIDDEEKSNRSAPPSPSPFLPFLFFHILFSLCSSQLDGWDRVWGMNGFGTRLRDIVMYRGDNQPVVILSVFSSKRDYVPPSPLPVDIRRQGIRQFVFSFFFSRQKILSMCNVVATFVTINVTSFIWISVICCCTRRCCCNRLLYLCFYCFRCKADEQLL